MCICEVSHFSNENNKPILKYDAKGNIVGLENTKYWQISLVGGEDSSNGAVIADTYVKKKFLEKIFLQTITLLLKKQSWLVLKLRLIKLLKLVS